jgi:hypothetical protein
LPNIETVAAYEPLLFLDQPGLANSNQGVPPRQRWGAHLGLAAVLLAPALLAPALLAPALLAPALLAPALLAPALLARGAELTGPRPVAMLAWLGLVATAGAYLLLPAAWLACRLQLLAL